MLRTFLVPAPSFHVAWYQVSFMRQHRCSNYACLKAVDSASDTAWRVLSCTCEEGHSPICYNSLPVVFNSTAKQNMNIPCGSTELNIDKSKKSPSASFKDPAQSMPASVGLKGCQASAKTARVKPHNSATQGWNKSCKKASVSFF